MEAEREAKATGRAPSKSTTINQANLVILIAALKSERWHFHMARVFASVIGKTIHGVSSARVHSCNTTACITGTISLLRSCGKDVSIHTPFTSANREWLGVDARLYQIITVPDGYDTTSALEPTQRAAAIAMLEDLSRGIVPTDSWLEDYIEDIERAGEEP